MTVETHEYIKGNAGDTESASHHPTFGQKAVNDIPLRVGGTNWKQPLTKC